MPPLVELVSHKSAKSLGRFWLQMLRNYFRIEVEGLEHIPSSGQALILPNHSGFAGADAVLLTYIIKRETRRRARLMAHRAFFDFSKTIKAVSENHGLKKASISGGVKILESGRLLILFPEGESGNFKASVKRYQLQKFKTGFLRIAIPTGAPIIPCLIIGAEETHLNLGALDFSGFIRNLRIPIPVNLFPLPAKWRIVFLPPLDLKNVDESLLRDPEGLEEKAAEIRKKLQKELRARVKERDYVYFRKTREIVRGISKGIKRIRAGF